MSVTVTNKKYRYAALKSHHGNNVCDTESSCHSSIKPQFCNLYFTIILINLVDYKKCEI